MEVDIGRIKVDPKLQFRAAGTTRELAEEYAEEIKAGTWDAAKGAVVVFQDADDPEERLLLADGFHTLEAHRIAGRSTILAEIRDGNFTDALFYALRANTTHGQKRSPEDTRNVVRFVIDNQDDLFKGLSKSEIGRRIGLKSSGISKVWRELTGEDPDPVKSAAATTGNAKRGFCVLDAKPSEPGQQAAPKPVKLAPSAFKVDPTVQQRADGLDESWVDELAAVLREGGEFRDPVVAFEDANGVIWLAGGFHRHAAAVKAEAAYLHVDLRNGDRRDALAFAVSDNADQVENGRPRTAADKRKAAMTCLADPLWKKLPDREIDRICRVSNGFTFQLRKELTGTKKSRSAPTPPVAPEQMLDGLGKPIPVGGMRDIFAGRECAEIGAQIERLAERLKALSSWNGHIKPNTYHDLSRLAKEVEGYTPFAVCDGCGGKGCASCMTSGFLPKWMEHDLKAKAQREAA